MQQYRLMTSWQGNSSTEEDLGVLMDNKFNMSKSSPLASLALLEKCSQQVRGTDPLFGTCKTMSTMLCLVLSKYKKNIDILEKVQWRPSRWSGGSSTKHRRRG